jgi:hypothetical protein
VGVFLLALVIHLPALWGDFVYDDLKVFLADPNLTSWATLPRVFVQPTVFFLGVASVFRPISSLSWGLDLLTWGRLGGEPTPLPFHLTNLLLHGLTAALLLLLLEPLIGRWRAVAAGALFAVHPATVEDVAWVVGRADMLAFLFCLAALLSLRLRSGWQRHLAVTLFALLAYGAKEVAILLPGLALLLALREPPDRRRRLLPAVWLTAAAALAYLAVHVLVVGSAKGFPVLFPGASPLERVQVALTVIAIYARILLWPHPLTVEYHWVGGAVPPLVWVAGLGVVAATAALCAAPRSRPVGLWMALLLLPLAPVVHLFPFFELVAERYLYLPSAAFCVLLAMGLDRLRRRSAAVGGWLLVGFVVAWSALTVNQCTVWLDAITLFENALKYAPASPVARKNLATAYVEAGFPGRAVPLWKMLLAADPANRDARFNLARWQLLHGRPRAALDLLGSRTRWAGDAAALAIWDTAAARAGPAP